MLGHIKKAALVFPGAGIELHNNEKNIYKKYQSLYAPFFREGSAAAGIDLSASLLNDAIPYLNDLQNQVFAYCFSAGTYRMLQANNLRPGFASGNSFGIYAALYAAGALSFFDGLSILKKAYDLVVGKNQGAKTGMRAVIGLGLEEIRGIISQLNLTTVIPINSNNELCHIIGGSTEELVRFDSEAFAAEVIKCVALPIELPYHHPLYLQGIDAVFARFLETISWHRPAYPVISTIDQQPLTDQERIIDCIAHHLCNPINWQATVEFLYGQGIDTVFECGPGLSLTQNARFIHGNVQWINMRNIESRFPV